MQVSSDREKEAVIQEIYHLNQNCQCGSMTLNGLPGLWMTKQNWKDTHSRSEIQGAYRKKDRPTVIKNMMEELWEEQYFWL